MVVGGCCWLPNGAAEPPCNEANAAKRVTNDRIVDALMSDLFCNMDE